MRLALRRVLRGSEITDRVATDRVIVAFGLEGSIIKRYFGSDQPVWRDGDGNGRGDGLLEANGRRVWVDRKVKMWDNLATRQIGRKTCR